MKGKKSNNKDNIFQEKISIKIIKNAVEKKNKTDKEFRTTYYKYKSIKYSMETKPLKLEF